MGLIVATEYMTVCAATRSDPFLELDDLEAALALAVVRGQGLAFAPGFDGLLSLARFHWGTSFK
jgi:hypothetical protein